MRATRESMSVRAVLRPCQASTEDPAVGLQCVGAHGAGEHVRTHSVLGQGAMLHEGFWSLRDVYPDSVRRRRLLDRSARQKAYGVYGSPAHVWWQKART